MAKIDVDENSSNDYFSRVKNRALAKGKTVAPTKADPMKARRALEEPSSTAAADAPFSIVSGVKNANTYLKIFLYGEFGAGKTVLSAQAVDVKSLRDVLFINIESGITSVIGSGAIENSDLLDIVPENGLKDFETFVRIHEMLVKYCQARDDDDQDRLDKMAKRYGFDPEKRYKTVIIDSLSELNQISLSRAFGDDQNDLLGSSESDDTRRDFGKNRAAMVKTIRAFRNLPMNVIATCGSQWDEDERKKIKYMPRLTGQLAKEVQAYWDVVGFLTTSAKKGEGEGDEATMHRRLWLQPIGKFDAKNRLASQDQPYLDNPTMGKLVSLLTKAKRASEGEAPPSKPQKRKG